MAPPPAIAHAIYFTSPARTQQTNPTIIGATLDGAGPDEEAATGASFGSGGRAGRALRERGDTAAANVGRVGRGSGGPSSWARVGTECVNKCNVATDLGRTENIVPGAAAAGLTFWRGGGERGGEGEWSFFGSAEATRDNRII